MSIPGPVSTVSNYVLMIMWALFMTTIMERRFSFWVTMLLWQGVFVLLFAAECIFEDASMGGRMSMLLILFTIPAFIYKKNIKRFIFATATYLFIMSIAEVTALAVFTDKLVELVKTSLFNTTEQLALQISSFASILMINGFLLLIAARCFSSFRDALPDREWRLFMLFPTSQIGAFFSWFYIVINGLDIMSLVILMLTTIVSIAADVGMYFAMRGMTQRAALQAEKNVLEKQIDGQRDHYVALTEQYEDIRHMRHDIDKHLSAISILLEDGKLNEAKEYSRELRENCSYKPNLGSCKNPVLDSFLFRRIEELQRQGIAVTARVNIPENMKINNVDLISSFGNLLDNAAEAGAKAENKSIALTADYIRAYLTIETDNSVCIEAEKSKKRRIPQLERGVGTHILRETAEKYNGEFKTALEGDRFRAFLTLQDK